VRRYIVATFRGIEIFRVPISGLSIELSVEDIRTLRSSIESQGYKTSIVSVPFESSESLEVGF
jgi:hypothetical protein